MRTGFLVPWMVALWLAASAVHAQSDWDVIAGDASLPGCRAMQCTDDSTCIRSFDPADTLAQVLAVSQDAGLTWSLATVSQSLARPVGTFFFRGARLGWAVATTNAASDAATVMRTTDGVTWLPADTFGVPGLITAPAQDGSSGITALHMVSNAVGYAAGFTLENGNGRPFLAYTSDGGRNWVERTPLELSSLTNAGIRAMHWVDEAVGVLSLSGSGVGTGLYRTEDAGMSFTEVSFGITQGPDPLLNPVVQFAFPTRTRGYALAVSTDQPGGFAATRDGGKTWEAKILDVDSAGNVLHLRASQMAFSDSMSGLIAGGDNGAEPMILRTRDGGLTFSTEELPTGWGSSVVPVQCVAALPGDVEYASGSSEARILRRGTPAVVGDTDGGVSGFSDAGTNHGGSGGMGPFVPGGGSGVPAGARGKDDGCSASPTPRTPTAAFALGLIMAVFAHRACRKRMPRRPAPARG